MSDTSKCKHLIGDRAASEPLPRLDYTLAAHEQCDARERQLRAALAQVKALTQERDAFAIACNLNQKGVEVVSHWIGWYNEKKNECATLRASRDELLLALHQTEWHLIAIDAEDHVMGCKRCRRTEQEGHAEDCPTFAAITNAEKAGKASRSTRRPLFRAGC